MSLENVILEIFGVIIVTVIPFFIFNMITISTITLPFNFLNDLPNNAKILIQPLIFYASMRIYCILVSYISDFIYNKVAFIKPQWTKFTMLASVGFIYFHDGSAQSLLSNLVYSYFGNLPELIYKNTKNDFLSVCQFGIRLICVISMWFFLMLIVEYFLGFALYVIGLILRKLYHYIHYVFYDICELHKFNNLFRRLCFNMEKVDSESKSK